MGGTDLRVVNRIARITGIVFVVFGALWAALSLITVWQAESGLADATYRYGATGPLDGAPTIADRIVAAQQPSFVGLFALLVLAAGLGLILAGAHLPDAKPAGASDPSDRRAPLAPEPPVMGVAFEPVEAESPEQEQEWGRVGPRTDEDPLRH